MALDVRREWRAHIICGRARVRILAQADGARVCGCAPQWQMLPEARQKAAKAAAEQLRECDIYAHDLGLSNVHCLKTAVRQAPRMTAKQQRVLGKVHELTAAQDWRGVLQRESEFRATAVALQATDPDSAAAIYSDLGLAIAMTTDV